MNYETIYNELIYKAKQRPKIIGQYYEKHHIVPKCLGGSNNLDNIVRLTAREHFIAHKLLFKFTIGKSKTKMGYALHKMLYPNNKNQIQRVSSRTYEELKRIYLYIRGQNHPSYGKKYGAEFRKRQSQNMIGARNPNYGKKPWNYNLTKELDSRLEVTEETRKKLSRVGKGRKHSEETKQIISKTHLGRAKSEDHKRKLSESLKGCKVTDETKRKMSISRRGKSQKKLCCPYCDVVGGTTMYRWHFENCKLKL
jgi:5-methylcytosine-specific restriction endonuclease McrA